MNKILIEKIKESLQSILPVTIIVFIIGLILGIPKNDLIEFVIGAFMLMIGLILFNIGASNSMMMFAEEIGGYITRRRSLIFLIFIAFIIGFMITVAEPSLWVLGEQFDAIPTSTLLLTVAIGLAFFLVIALLRIIFQMKLAIILIISYLLIFAFAIFIPSSFIPIAFDSGGITTGPMAVPFIIALGLGVSSARGDYKSSEDSFGLIGISSIGPIFVVFILGLFYNSEYIHNDSSLSFISYILKYLLEVGIAIIPFIILFMIFQLFAIKLSKRKVIRIMIGFFFTYLGLVVFLVGANAGFISIGSTIGEKVALLDYNWLLIIFGMLFGFTIVSAEPAIIVLTKQVEEITAGAISKKLMIIFIAMGVSIAIGLSCLRILYNISIWWVLLPGYLISLILTFFVPKIFTAIAFDSGGAVSGALTSTFLVPFALGAASVIYQDPSDILANAFGLVAYVAMAPLVTIQILGLVYNLKTRKVKVEKVEEEIINLNEVKK